ncbi:DsrE family protein [Aquiflexum lacus]|uniref:DsrE family protein n=1 Tax=Aquiflexum lacus TaxID=2483805 RepID=UPI00189604D1|nr:DsrE family protein [Aquiflexum lacus]
MRASTLFILLLLTVFAVKAQVSSEAEHRIIFQITDGNPETHSKFLRQLNNVLAAAPNSKIEVVTHGMGVDLLKKDNNSFSNDLENLVDKGVDFVVCENTLKQRKLKKEEFLSLASFVPSAILELVIKQEQGWIYIKAGG